MVGDAQEFQDGDSSALDQVQGLGRQLMKLIQALEERRGRQPD